MRLTLEIIEERGRKHFRTYDDTDTGNEGLEGIGWTITDAVDDYVQAYNRVSFLDGDTPVILRRDDIELRRVKISCRRV